MHAAVVVRDDWAYVIIAPASGGKSTLAKQMVENQPGKAFIFSDDRIVLGALEGTPVVWTTPWSKISNGNPALHFEVRCICMVEKSASCSICDALEAQIVLEILNEYPDECRPDVKRVFSTFELKKCNLVWAQSNIDDLPIGRLYEMMN